MRVFISYKIINSDIVRQVVAWLEHNGVDTWFAEAQIPLDFQFHDEKIAELIAEGVSKCTHAIVFSNEMYASSKWCTIEAEQLARKFGRAPTARILQVLLPEETSTFELLPILGEWTTHSICLDPHTFPDLTILEASMRVCGWSLPNPMKCVVTNDEWLELRHDLPLLGLSVNLQGFELEDMKSEVDPAGDDYQQEDLFYVDVKGSVRLCISSSRHDRRTTAFSMNDTISDGELRRQAVERAKLFAEDSRQLGAEHCDITAVHLCFLGNKSHFGITYEMEFPMYGTIAARKYCLHAWDQRTRNHYEIILTFHVYGAMRRLIALSPLLDAALHSFTQSEVNWRSYEIATGRAGDSINARGERSNPLSRTSQERLSDKSFPFVWFEGAPEKPRVSFVRQLVGAIRSVYSPSRRSSER